MNDGIFQSLAKKFITTFDLVGALVVLFHIGALIFAPFGIETRLAHGAEAKFTAVVFVKMFWRCWIFDAALGATFGGRGTIGGSHGLTPVAHGPGVHSARGHSYHHYSTNILCVDAQPPSCDTCDILVIRRRIITS